MTLGKSPTSEDVFRSGTDVCRERVSATSIDGLLYRESHRLFPDEAFADLFANIGRASVPPRIVAVVMVLQRLEGLSDREAVDRPHHVRTRSRGGLRSGDQGRSLATT